MIFKQINLNCWLDGCRAKLKSGTICHYCAFIRKVWHKELPPKKDETEAVKT